MLLFLALAGCEPAADVVPLDPPPVRGPLPPLAWTSSPEGVEVTTIQVPYDHAHPEAGTFPMRIGRAKHRFNMNYKGVILMNFGGPGADGVGYLPWFGSILDSLRDDYDLVSFDVRGGGYAPDAEPLGCMDGELLDAVLDAYDGVGDETHIEAVGAAAKAWFDHCRDTNPKLVDHMGMNAWADDMDTIREALGVEKISYYGASAGTGLGLTYAERHPDRVDRFVLDSTLDAYGGAYGVYKSQLDGIPVVTQLWADWCAEDATCAVHDDPEGAIAEVLARSSSEDPLEVDGRPLTFGRAAYGIGANLYSEYAWSWLGELLAAAREGDGTLLMDSSDGYFGRYPNEDGEIAYSTMTGISNLVWCADNVNPTTAADIAAWTAADGAALGPMAKLGGFDLAWCLEVPPTDPVDHPATAAGTPPMLMLQSTPPPPGALDASAHHLPGRVWNPCGRGRHPLGRRWRADARGAGGRGGGRGRAAVADLPRRLDRGGPRDRGPHLRPVRRGAEL